eukprot:8114784-Heterocapsa_arctica.AAC.1
MAITGMISQNGFLGTTGPETLSPASAFGTDPGVQVPVDFWDSRKLAADSYVHGQGATEWRHGLEACV